MTGPKIRAAFVTDGQGRPYSSDDGRHTHYRIRLSLKGAPEGTRSVTYRLHETYGEPLREVGQGPSYEDEITSYGDFNIKALIRTLDDFDVVTARLLEALRETHATDPSPEVSTAISVLENQ